MPRLLPLWLPVALWCVVIFAFSSVGGSGLSGGFLDFLMRKGAHLGEYAVLMLLTRRALAGSGAPLPEAGAFLFCLLYAAGDEWHQTFVPLREGRPSDVLIDACGAAAAWVLARWRRAKF